MMWLEQSAEGDSSLQGAAGDFLDFTGEHVGVVLMAVICMYGREMTDSL